KLNFGGFRHSNFTNSFSFLYRVCCNRKRQNNSTNQRICICHKEFTHSKYHLEYPLSNLFLWFCSASFLNIPKTLPETYHLFFGMLVLYISRFFSAFYHPHPSIFLRLCYLPPKQSLPFLISIILLLLNLI